MAARSKRWVRLSAACALALLAACSQRPAGGKGAGLVGGDRIFVSNERGDTISVIDPATGTVVATLNPGKRPRGLALSPDGTRLYVALSGSAIAGPEAEDDNPAPADRSLDGIGVIDLSGLTLGKLIKAGADPETFAVSPDGATLFISNEDTSETSVLDLKSGEIRAHIRVGGEPEGAAVTPDGRILLVACESANAIYVIDIARLAVVGIIPVDGRPRALAITPDGRLAYASSENLGKVAVLDIAARKVASTISIPDTGPAPAQGEDENTSPTAPRPMGMVFNADRSRLYVTTGRGRSVAEIDVATNAVSRMFKGVGERPWGIAISPDGKSLYTANGMSNDVSQIDIASGTVVKRIPVGASPWGVVYAARR